MHLLRKCDFCDKQAIVDGKTQMGPWAYMCPDHLQQHGYPSSKMNTKLVADYPSLDYTKEVGSNVQS